MDKKIKIVQEKLERIRAAIDIKDYDRPPIVARADFWPVKYSGKYSIQEAFYDVDKLTECYDAAFKDLDDWDAFGTFMFCLGPMLDALGSRRYVIPGQHISENASFQVPDLTLMNEEDYPKLIENPIKFQLEELAPKLCTRLLDPEPFRSKALIKAAIYCYEWGEKVRNYSKKQGDEHGVPPLFQGAVVYGPLQWILHRLRGFAQGLLDVKIRPEEVQEACEALLPFMIQIVRSSAPNNDYPLIFSPQDVSPFLSPKDYEKSYWPTFKKLVDELTSSGYRLYILFDGNHEQHLERLQDLPKGKVVLHFDNTDLKKVKKYLGGRVCIAAGLPAHLLFRGNPDEVRERTTEIIKLFSDLGGFMMTTGAAIPVNAKAENLRALLNTVINFKM